MNIVEKQLHNILYIERESNLLSSSRMKTDCRWFAGKFFSGCKSAGRARVFQGDEKKETYNIMRMIILDRTKRATKASVEFGNPLAPSPRRIRG